MYCYAYEACVDTEHHQELDQHITSLVASAIVGRYHSPRSFETSRWLHECCTEQPAGEMIYSLMSLLSLDGATKVRHVPELVNNGTKRARPVYAWRDMAFALEVHYIQEHEDGEDPRMIEYVSFRGYSIGRIPQSGRIDFLYLSSELA